VKRVYPVERVYKERTSLVWLCLLGSIAFVAAGVWATHEEDLSILGLFSIGFIGLGIPVFLLKLLRPSANYLKLDEEGFNMVGLGIHNRTKWTEVEAFQMTQMDGQGWLKIIYSAEYKKQKIARSIASALGEMEGAIPNIYSEPLQDIFLNMTAWKKRYDAKVTGSSPTPNDGESLACLKCNQKLEFVSQPQYCPYCGSNQLEPESRSLPPHCLACGRYLKDGGKSRFAGHIHYCAHCGFKIPAGEPAASAARKTPS